LRVTGLIGAAGILLDDLAVLPDYNGIAPPSRFLSGALPGADEGFFYSFIIWGCIVTLLHW
jgi:hypothetical protein